MVAIALLCAIIYYIVLLVQAAMVVMTLCRKQENIEALSENAKKRYSVRSLNEDTLVCTCNNTTGGVLHVQVSVSDDIDDSSSLRYNLPAIRDSPPSMAERQ